MTRLIRGRVSATCGSECKNLFHLSPFPRSKMVSMHFWDELPRTCLHCTMEAQNEIQWSWKVGRINYGYWIRQWGYLEYIKHMSCHTCPFKTPATNAVSKNVLNSNSIFDSPVMLNSPIVCFKWPSGIPKKLLPGTVSIWTAGLLKESVEVFCKRKALDALCSLYSDCDTLTQYN